MPLQGEPLLNPATRKAEAVLAEFRASKADVWSSKDVLQIIRRKTAPGAAAAALSSAPSIHADAVAPAIGAHIALWYADRSRQDHDRSSLSSRNIYMANMQFSRH